MSWVFVSALPAHASSRAHWKLVSVSDESAEKRITGLGAAAAIVHKERCKLLLVKEPAVPVTKYPEPRTEQCQHLVHIIILSEA